MLRYAFGKYQLGFITNGGCYMDTARDSLAQEALKYNPDYLLWLDADQIYPGNTPEVLMNHIDSGKTIVGGVSPLKKTSDKTMDGRPSVWDIDEKTNLSRHRRISLRQGVIRVDGMGLGGVMTSPEVFKKMEYPWFRMTWNPDTKHRPAVDLQFFGNCKRAGVDVWCDTDLIYGHMAVRPIELNEGL